MDISRHISTITAVILILITASCIQYLRPRVNLTREDVVIDTLEIALGEHQIPDASILLDQPDPVILSKHLIEDYPIKGVISGHEIAWMSDESIQARTEVVGDFLYLKFEGIALGNNSATVTISNRWATPVNSGHLFLSGGWIKIRFFWMNGAYQHEIVEVAIA